MFLRYEMRVIIIQYQDNHIRIYRTIFSLLHLSRSYQLSEKPLFADNNR